MSRLIALSLANLLLALGTLSMDARAGDREGFEPYTAARLAELQAQGKPVLVDVHADWCPTCRRQGPILDALLKEQALSGYAALKLDWDSQQDEARRLGAPRQSTLFVFRDGKKLGMSIAETHEARLRTFLLRGVE